MEAPHFGQMFSPGSALKGCLHFGQSISIPFEEICFFAWLIISFSSRFISDFLLRSNVLPTKGVVEVRVVKYEYWEYSVGY